MQKFYKWEGVTSSNRTIIIDQIKSAIFTSGGAIINFKQFSDLNLGLNIEIEERNLESLFLGLSNIISLERKDADKVNRDRIKDVKVLLNVSFAKGTGNMRSEIPDVPG